MSEAKVGLNVHVFSPDKETDWGVGIITKVGKGPLGSTSYPTIKLEDGRTIGGIDCWWYPLPENSSKLGKRGMTKAELIAGLKEVADEEKLTAAEAAAAFKEGTSTAKMIWDEKFGSSRRVTVIIYEDDPYNQDESKRGRRETQRLGFDLAVDTPAYPEGLKRAIEMMESADESDNSIDIEEMEKDMPRVPINDFLRKY